MIDFSNRLSEILNNKGVTKRELAKKTGITEQSICRYANGNRVPKATEIIMIADALEIDANELLGTTKKDVCVKEILLKLSILANDTKLPLDECIEYHKAKIIVEKLYKEIIEKTEI